MSNASLSDFSSGTNDGDRDAESASAPRPDEEARYVAGDDDPVVSEVFDAESGALPDVDATIDLMVTQVDYTVEGSGERERPVIHVFGRTDDNAVEHVRVHGFRPYFYAPTDSLDEGDLAKGVITGHEEGYESIRGDDLTKIFGRTPRDVGNIRDEYDHYEADILFPNRFLIDKDVNSGIRVPARRAESDGALVVRHDEVAPVEAEADLRVNTFDIEVDDRNGFPEEGEEPIVCLTSHDSYRDEYITWLQTDNEGDAPAPDDLADYDLLDDAADATLDVRVFETEEAMLEAFVDYVRETDADILTGWNCLPADSRIQMADGSEKEIQHVEVGDDVVGSDDQCSTVAEVTNKWESEKRIYEFSLADGTTLRSSGDHRVMIGDDEDVDWKEGRDVEPGEYVLKPRTLPVEDPAVPTLRDLTPIETHRYDDDAVVREFKSELPYGAVTELAGEFDVSKGTLYHPTTDTWTPSRCETAAEKYGVPLPDGGRRYRRTGVPLDRALTEEEVYLAGLVLTDGTMSPTDGIRFYNTREELHDQFPGGGKLEPDGTGCYKQNVLDYATMHAFNGLGIPFGNKNADEVDLSTVYEMPESYVARFLAGAIDGDGNVSSYVTLAAENRTVGEWYVRLFKRLGIYAQQNGNVVRVPNAERDIERLKDTVLPNMSHSEKVERLTELDGGKSGQTETIPYALFDADVGSDAKRIGNDKHRRGINLKRHETRSTEWEEYVFVEVEDVEMTGTETTYDIETTTHDFVAEECLVHNCDDFDAPYFIDRMDVLGLDYRRLSRVDEVWTSGWGGPNIKGRVVFDLLYAYQRTQFSELDSYRLDAVGETELGVGKERYAGDIGDLWEDDPERLLEYNVRDVELCVEIDRKQDVISFWEEVSTFVGCKLEDATTPGDAVDVYVLHKAHGRFVLPSKGQQESEDYEGGAVFDPITGVKENVTVLDLKCFSGDTDLLTPDGVRNITDVEVGDPVYTLNPETFECEVKPVEQTHHYPNEYGELHHLSGNTHDLKVTENHRFLASSTRGWDEQTPHDFAFMEYRDLADAQRYAFPSHEPMRGETAETFDLYADVDDGYAVVYSDDDLRVFRAAMPDAVTESLTLVHGSSQALQLEKTGKYLVPIDVFREHETRIREFSDHVFLKYDRQHRETPLSFEMTDWLELVGWYVTEGSTDRENGRLTLHQNDESGRSAIRDLLDRMGINYNLDNRGINVSNRYLLEWLSENCGEGYASKRLPDGVFELDSTLLDRLLRTMIAGDGSAGDEGTVSKFWTKSDSLKEGFVQVAVRCGHKPTVTKQSDGIWYVSVGKRGSFNKSVNATVEEHDGDVHCVTAADNHVVLAGRNGHFQWVGQSLYPMAMRTINASPETKVDPESYDGDTFHAPNGTHFREEPDGIIREIIEETLNEREEKKGLRNDHDPGSNEYERYDRQQSAVKVIMNCFTPDTDVLTPDGVRNIRDLDVGDTVYSLDPETLEMEEKPVVETHDYPDYRGDLVDVETSKTDFSITPNHRMLVRKDDKNGASWDDYRFVEAGDLNNSSHYELPHDWSMEHGDPVTEVDLTEYVEGDYEVWVRPSVHGRTFTAELGWTPRRVPKADIGKTGYVFSADEFEEHREYIESVCETSFVHRESGRKWIPRTYAGDDFLELLAWYVTEGNVYTSESKQFGENFRGSATTVKIAQNAITDGGDADDHARIGTLLDRMGFDYSVDDRAYQFTSKLLGDFLEALCGEDSFEKQIPEIVFEADEAQKRQFLGTLVAGDEDRQVNSWRYTTSSDRLRDDVLRLCAHLGETASYNRNSGSWRVYCTEGTKNSFRMHRSGGTSTATDGVYCVTVEDNHTLLAGRNGKLQWTGNSLYGVLGWERFRLYDKEMGAAVTATGREAIEFTEEAANERGKEVIYGDTDSVMLELGQEVSKEEAIEQSFDLEEYINDRYDAFALEELDAAVHHFQIEFEKLYRRFFQAGKKKRYAGHIVWKEGKDVDDIDITGFEYKRSDIAPITKDVQKQVIDMIVHGEETDAVKEYVHDVVEDFRDGNVDLDDVGIPGGIGKRLDNYDTDTAQVRGAKYANLLLGTNFQRGSKPKRLYLKKVHPEFFREMEAENPKLVEDPLYIEFKRDPDVICYEYADQIPDAFEVDWETMLEKTLKGPIERITEALGVSWDEVESGQTQTGLGSYM